MSYSKNRNCQKLLSHLRLEKSWGPVSSGRYWNQAVHSVACKVLEGIWLTQEMPSKQGLRGEMSSTISCCVLVISQLPVFPNQPGSQRTQKPVIKSRVKHESRGSLRIHRQINDWQRDEWDRGCEQSRLWSIILIIFSLGKRIIEQFKEGSSRCF